MKKRDVLNSPRLQEIKRKKLRVFWNRVLLFFVSFLLLATGLVFFSRWERINVQAVEVTGLDSENTEIVEKLVEEKISGHYLFVFPKTNILLLPEKSIKEELATSFKRFKNIETNITDTADFQVTLSMREAEYLWCGEEASLVEEVSKCYFMDDSGYIFDEAPYFSGDVYFKFFGKVAGGEGGPVGKYFILPETFEKVSFFRDILEQMSINPVSLYMMEDGDMEFYLQSSSSGDTLPPRIIFKPYADFVKLSENLQTALVTEPLRSEFEKKYESLEYIDLRFGNKVYYKFR